MTETIEQPHERIFNLLFQEDELTWQTIIYDLVKSESMNPWDINVSLIALKFLERLKQLKNMDFRISGKIVFASALLLKIKSDRLLHEDLVAFDNLMASSEEEMLDVLDELAEGYVDPAKPVLPQIHPRVPQPRKRKVSVFDLVEALEQALEVENRRKQYILPEVRMRVPEKKKDMSLIIKDIYSQIKGYFKDSRVKLTFSQLIPSDTKEDKVLTFIPLLHLDNQSLVDLSQQEHFGEIFVHLNKRNLI
ncbi:MAG: segregation/condensation protein A [Nanoarchaeota archaeon]|nr:segregation/condensation protein A [Nanoarchaeota archaeon]